MSSNPWIGVVLVVLGLIAMVVFSLVRLPAEGGIAVAIITAGIAIAQARGHESTQRELVTLRRSMRPPDALTGAPSLPSPPAPDPSQPFPPESSTGSITTKKGAPS
jgi:hypothetical protein